MIAATNRIDILDPALLRSGRLDRKIEFPLPTETARAQILEIHSRKMTTSPDVNYEELARSTDEFNGAQLKAVCVEAGMIALREGATRLDHEHFLSGIAEGEHTPLISPCIDLILLQCKVRKRIILCTSLRWTARSDSLSLINIINTFSTLLGSGRISRGPVLIIENPKDGNKNISLWAQIAPSYTIMDVIRRYYGYEGYS